MTGVLEPLAIAAALGYAFHSKTEKELQQRKVAAELYSRHFHADLFELSPDRPTVLLPALPPELDTNAAASIRVIERYQQERKRWFMGVATSREVSGDVRTHVLEELKQWLLTLSQGNSPAAEVSARLDYCWQFMLHPVAFGSSNQVSFLGTIAEVCRQLEQLYQSAATSQRDLFAQVGRLLNLGREAVHATLPALLLGVLDSACAAVLVGGGLPEGEAGGELRDLPDSLGPRALLAAAAAAEGSGAGWRTDAGRVLKALLHSRHMHRLGAPDEEEPSDETPVAGSDAPAPLGEVLAEVRGAWAADGGGADSGLLEVFRGTRHQEVRAAFLDLCGQLDSAAFFLCALRPYRRVAGAAGDIAMCWLRRGLEHLLQELESSLVRLRQARLEVLRASKRHVQELAKRFAELSPAEVRWMQALRHADEGRLDRLHRAVVAACRDVRAATATAREVELQKKALQGLDDIACAFQSADFQARCALPLPDGLASSMKQLAGSPALPRAGLLSLSDKVTRMASDGRA